MQGFDAFRTVECRLFEVVAQHLAAVRIKEWLIVVPVRHDEESILVRFPVSVHVFGQLFADFDKFVPIRGRSRYPCFFQQIAPVV
ncbi:hypothetical protein D1872_261670 [compost metagenome]